MCMWCLILQVLGVHASLVIMLFGVARVSSTGGCGGGEASPPNTPTSPPKSFDNTISNNKNSGFMFFCALVKNGLKNFACYTYN